MWTNLAINKLWGRDTSYLDRKNDSLYILNDSNLYPYINETSEL